MRVRYQAAPHPVVINQKVILVGVAGFLNQLSSRFHRDAMTGHQYPNVIYFSRGGRIFKPVTFPISTGRDDWSSISQCDLFLSGWQDSHLPLFTLILQSKTPFFIIFFINLGTISTHTLI